MSSLNVLYNAVMPGHLSVCRQYRYLSVCLCVYSMNTSSHRRSANVMFHNIGLGNFNSDAFDPRQDIYVKDNQKWKMRTLKSVVQMLGHENRVIDVLKIDIEGHEWAVVENLIETGMFPFVRQFMLE